MKLSHAAVIAALLAPLPATADTLLRLSETAHVSVTPDEIVAVLRASAITPAAAEAQGRVNTQIARALDEARRVPGITTSTGSYNVWQRTQPSVQWTASQTILLKGRDGEKMLQLVATLQAQQLAVERLAWQVSPEAGRKAAAEATRLALTSLRSRGEDAAAILGLKFSGFREIRLDGQRPSPAPMAMRAMATETAAAAPPMPRAEAQDIDIQASAEAEIILTPG